jgi:hypothetical protein
MSTSTDKPAGAVAAPGPAPATPRPALRRRLGAHLVRDDATVTARELLVVAVLALAFLAVVFGRHALRGGFLEDDWANYARYALSPDGGFFGRLHWITIQDNIQNRPVNGLYITLLEGLLGPHMSWQLAWSMGLGALMGTVLYWLGRLLRFPPWQLACFLVLLLLFPGGSSLRLWIAAAGAQGSITLAVAGLATAVVAFRAGPGRRALVLHGASVLLLAASLLWYESALSTVLVLGPLLYRLVAGRWRPALTRWAVDVVVLGTLAKTVTSHSNFPRQDTGGVLHHVHQMWDSARTLLFTEVLPFGASTWFGFAVVLALLGLGAAAYLLGAPGPERRATGRHLATALAGLAIVALGYAMYAPSIEYYEPAAPGIANRINNVAGIGWMVFVAGTILLVMTLAFRDARRRRAAVIAGTAVATLALAVSYTSQLRKDERDFQRGFQEGQRVLTTLRYSLPKPQQGTTIWTFGQPVEIRPGFPVFGNTFDMTASVQVLWHDPTLTGLVAYPGVTFDCGAAAVTPGGNGSYPGNGAYASPYGKTIFINTVDGTYAVIRDRRQCLKLAPAFPRAVSFPPPTA